MRASTVLQSRLVVAVKVLLREIAGLFDGYESELPSEVRRDRHLNINALFRALNIWLRDNILVQFLAHHDDCRQRIAWIFGCRYQYLNYSDRGDGSGSLSPTQQLRVLARSKGRATGDGDAPTTTWVPDLDVAQVAALSEQELEMTRAAIRAFDAFELASFDEVLEREDVTDPLTIAELNAIGELLILEDMGLDEAGKEQAWTELRLQLEPADPEFVDEGLEEEDEDMPDVVQEEPDVPMDDSGSYPLPEAEVGSEKDVAELVESVEQESSPLPPAPEPAPEVLPSQQHQAPEQPSPPPPPTSPPPTQVPRDVLTPPDSVSPQKPPLPRNKPSTRSPSLNLNNPSYGPSPNLSRRLRLRRLNHRSPSPSLENLLCPPLSNRNCRTSLRYAKRLSLSPIFKTFSCGPWVNRSPRVPLSPNNQHHTSSHTGGPAAEASSASDPSDGPRTAPGPEPGSAVRRPGSSPSPSPKRRGSDRAPAPERQNFLRERTTLRSPEWRARFAQVIDMTSRLERVRNGDESWGRALEQVLVMIRTHHAYMQYHDNRKQIIAHTADAAAAPPKQQDTDKPSKLPVLNLSLHDAGETSKRAGRWTYKDAKRDSDSASVSDTIEELYRQRHHRDARSFWSKSQTIDKSKSGLWGGSSKGKRLNVVQFESKYFEECMRKGPAHTAKVLRKAQDRSTKLPSDAKELSDDQFESLARLKGYQRAALQQSLNLFDSYENRVVGANHWQTLLPDVAKSRKDELAAGRKYPVKPSRLDTSRTKAPAAADKGPNQDQDGGLDQAADWSKADEMMLELGKLWNALVKYRTLYDILLQAARRAPRPLITSVIKDVRAGVVGSKPGNANVSTGSLPALRPLEARWLEFLCLPSATDTRASKKRQGEREKLFVDSVQAMLDDPSASSFFCDMAPKMAGPFLEALNCAPTLRQKPFTVKELAEFVPKLDKMNIIRTYVKDKKTPMLGRPEHTVHPEQRIRWDDSGNAAKADAEGANAEELEALIKLWDSTKIFDTGVDDAAPAKGGGDASYVKELPTRSNLRSLASCTKKPREVKADQARTEKLFSQLAYRLGSSLRAVQDAHATKRFALQELLGVKAGGSQSSHPEESGVSYAERAMQRRKFQPGPAEFWLGDTPLQRKRIEQRLQAQLDPDFANRGRKRSWGARLRGMFGRGKQGDGDDEEEARARFPRARLPAACLIPRARRSGVVSRAARGCMNSCPHRESGGSRAKDKGKGKGKAVSFAREPTFLDRHRGDSDLSQSETEGQARRDGAARKRKDPPSPRPTRPAKRGWFGGGKTVRSEKLNLHVMPPDDGESFW
ncbi:hypothetical protein ACCO45_007108 [Purpureocillium lilacinum]|uniref:Uncharacterized protein n=1 Tax=Purpureocillium lilacinum TaxID=33203 RepID=A0ACC4DU42_PURLI